MASRRRLYIIITCETYTVGLSALGSWEGVDLRLIDSRAAIEVGSEKNRGFTVRIENDFKKR